MHSQPWRCFMCKNYSLLMMTAIQNNDFIKMNSHVVTKLNINLKAKCCVFQ